MFFGVTAIVLALSAGWALTRSQRSTVERSWLALAPAVPDVPMLEGAAYRGEGPGEASVGEPGSRKALALRGASEQVKRRHLVASTVAPGVTAALFAVLGLGLGPWAGFVGGLFGLCASASLLRDDRRLMGVLLASVLPIAIINFPLGVGCLGVFFGMRTLMDQKDAVALREADREREADPRYLAGSTERRAGGVAFSRRGGGDITAPTARDNSKA
jgi:hypothetical protein